MKDFKHRRAVPVPKKKFPVKFLLIFILIICLFFTALYFVLPKTWDGKSKLTLVSQTTSGDVNLVILDPSSPTITEILIPASTQVDASHDLGTWKLGSITKLGINQNLPGDFLKKTVIKSFNFPVDNWGGEDILEIKSLFERSPSGLTFMDKLKIVNFALQTGSSNRFFVDLSKTVYLERVQLPDGSLGYKITGTISPSLVSLFAIPALSNSNLTILINKANSNSMVEVVSKTIQFMGMKVTSIQTAKSAPQVCKITGQNKNIVTRIANIFSCNTSFSKPDNNFDLQIDLSVKNSL